MPSLRTIFRAIATSFLAILLFQGTLLDALGPVTHASAQAVNFSQTFINGTTHIALFVITILNFFAWLMLFVLHHVLDPEFIFDINDAGEDGPFLLTLHQIWQFMRDLVNMGFAVGLIAYAIKSIVTADMSDLKEKLKKFVLALVLVNFSWFIPRAIFDLSQVLTYTVYQIPSLIGMEGCELPPGPDDTAPRPCKVVVDFRFLKSQTSTIVDGDDGWKCPLPPLVCVQMRNLEDADDIDTPNRILDGLVANHARLQWLADINFREDIPPDLRIEEVTERLIGVAVKLIMLVALHIAILFPLLAMAAAFIIRIPVLWLTMAFMPLVALGHVFESVNEMVKPIQDQFLQAVFLPVKVAIPFSIAFIMLNIGAQAHVAPSSFGTLERFPLFSGVSDLWQLLWMCIALFVLWKYAFEALKSDKAGMMGMFTDKIEGFGRSLGEFAVKLPLSTPIIPVPGGLDADGNPRRASPLEFLHAGRNMLSQVNQLGRLPNFGEALGGTRGGGGGADKAAVEQVQKAAKTGSINTLTVNQNVQTNVLAGGLNNDAQNKALTAELQNIVNNNTFLRGRTQRQLIDLLNRGGVLTNPTELKRLQEIADRAGATPIN